MAPNTRSHRKIVSLDKEGEEEAAIQGLVGRVAPKAISKKDHFISYSTNLCTCTYPKIQHGNM